MNLRYHNETDEIEQLGPIDPPPNKVISREAVVARMRRLATWWETHGTYLPDQFIDELRDLADEIEEGK